MAGENDKNMEVATKGDPLARDTGTKQVAMVGSEFCVPYPMEFSVVKKVMTLKDGAFQVTDQNGNVLFKVKGKVFSLVNKRTLVDGGGKVLVTFQQKLLSAHNRWQAFKGDSTDPKDLLFIVKRSALIQLMKTNLNVYLAGNTKEEACDFKIEGSWFEKSCTIYAGKNKESPKIAEMSKKLTAGSVLAGKDNFGVSVEANVDHAFVVSLIVILDEINEAYDKLL